MRRDEILARLTAHREEIEGFGVESLRLFGSMARGEAAANSDVDLLVRFRETPTFSGYMKLRIFLEDLLGAKVDLVTESGLREAVRPFVEKDAIRVASGRSSRARKSGDCTTLRLEAQALQNP